MKIKLKYPLILGVLLALLLVNAVPVLLLPEKAALTNFSVFPGAVAVLMIIYGLCALIDKHKGNYFQLSAPRGRTLSYNKSYTYKEAYEREFRLSMLIYFGAIPFYIPLIFFTRSYPSATFGTPRGDAGPPDIPGDPFDPRGDTGLQGAQADPGRKGAGAHRAGEAGGIGEVEMT